MTRALRSGLLLAAAAAPLLVGVATRSRKVILVAAALTPVLLGVVVASDPRPRRGLLALIVLVAGFELALGLVLYYIWLTLPWG